jgi:hypothetical protein
MPGVSPPDAGGRRRAGGGRGPWARLRRRSFAPSRPALHPDQAGLIVFTVAVFAGAIFVVVRFLL